MTYPCKTMKLDSSGKNHQVLLRLLTGSRRTVIAWIIRLQTAKAGGFHQLLNKAQNEHGIESSLPTHHATGRKERPSGPRRVQGKCRIYLLKRTTMAPMTSPFLKSFFGLVG